MNLDKVESTLMKIYNLIESHHKADIKESLESNVSQQFLVLYMHTHGFIQGGTPPAGILPAYVT